MRRALIAIACSCVSFGAQAVTLSPGDILGLSAGIIRIDPTTGVQTQVAVGLFYDFAIGADGRLYATAGDSVLRIDPADGSTSVLTSGGILLSARSIVVAADGRVYVSTPTTGGGSAIVGVDPATGAQQLVASDPYGHGLRDLGITPDNRLVLLGGTRNDSSPGLLAFVAIDTGVITFTAGSGVERTGLAVSALGEIFAADSGGQCGCTYRWDALTDQWQYLTFPPYPPGTSGSDGIFDVAVEASGSLLLAENGADAQVYRFDPLSDRRDPASFEVVTNGSFHQLEVVPVPEPGTALVLSLGLLILAASPLRPR